MERNLDQGLSLAARVHPKYAPVFEALDPRDRAAVALYFLPHGSKKDVFEVTRPRVIKWYCPFADQRQFPSGHRYCINVYTGCEHACQYCYAAGYVDARPKCKNDFRAGLLKDLESLDAYDTPPAPVHLSNSTDPLQSLEQSYGDTLYALERLAERRHRFTTVTLLTKNPAVLTEGRYLAALRRVNVLPADHPRRGWFEAHACPPLRVECSLAFFNDAHRLLLDPAAPSVEDRMEAIRFLSREAIPVFVRIDPLFPRDPLGDGKKMTDFDLPDVQPLGDLESLVAFSRDVGARHIVYSPAKITRRRGGTLSPVMAKMRRVYEHLAAGRAVEFRGGSWRLPQSAGEELVLRPFLQLCRQYGVEAKACKASLLSTP